MGHVPGDLHDLDLVYAKVQAVPHAAWNRDARYAPFSAGDLAPLLKSAADRDGVLLIGPGEVSQGLGLPVEASD